MGPFISFATLCLDLLCKSYSASYRLKSVTLTCCRLPKSSNSEIFVFMGVDKVFLVVFAQKTLSE